MLALIQAINKAITETAGYIAADWNYHGDCDKFHDRESILAMMQKLSMGHPEIGVAGFIHPVYTPKSKMMFGVWGF